MNRTNLIPEYAITVLSLGYERLASGNLAIALQKLLAIQAQVPADIIDFSLANIGSAIPFATISATLAGKQIIRCDGIRGHGASPWLF